MPPERFENLDDFLRRLGSVPAQRVIFDPPPGTATEADLLRLVERDKRLCELIDGTLVEKPVSLSEARITSRLIIRLGSYVELHGLGDVSGPDSTLRMASTGRLRLPDVIFISKARLPDPSVAVPTLAPDLAVEVLSETNSANEINQKLREYFQSGTRLAWIVEPRDRNVRVHHSPDTPTVVLQETDFLDGEDVVPGFRMLVADLFAGLTPPAHSAN